MSVLIKSVFAVYVLLFFLTGGLTVFISLDTAAVPAILRELQYTVFIWHLACWIVLGMLANYLWDLFNADKKLSDIRLEKLLLPLLVSPIVLYATWNLFVNTGKEVSFLIELIAFQNGFFWQAIFSKAGPATKP
ncbi:MAG: hypothetical protein HGB36_09305 [Chlorobiaceae bacterium]|nr:hypothetical protein [Chlorobiaceae bacterium]